MHSKKEASILELKKAMDAYTQISKESWELMVPLLHFYSFTKGEEILRAGHIGKNIYFLSKGIVRSYYTDADGNSYTKNLFLEKSFPASKASLILEAPSNFSIQALEDVFLVGFNFKEFKKLMESKEDFKNFYIAYIEKNWIVEKEKKEISLVMETAAERYFKLIKQHPTLENRIPQHYIASHLGITPTQLSRIRKKYKE